MVSNPLISLEKVSLSFGSKMVLNKISLNFLPQEVVSIIGVNGAGKTSLLKLIAGIYKPNSGKIIRHTDRISYVPQKLHFDTTLPVTVMDFLKLYNTRISTTKINQTLDELQIKNLANSMIGGLSGGQVQRVLLAQALINDPEVLLLDEPTASIDLLGEELFFEILDGLFQKRKLTIVLVSHDIHTVFAKSTRVVCLNEHVCCVGKPQDVSNHKDFKEIFGTYLAPYNHTHDKCKHHEH